MKKSLQILALSLFAISCFGCNQGPQRATEEESKAVMEQSDVQVPAIPTESPP